MLSVGKAVLHNIVALSTTEAEYIAIIEACKETMWLRGLFSEINEDICLQFIMIVRVLFF